jgi:hypothetical protein
LPPYPTPPNPASQSKLILRRRNQRPERQQPKHNARQIFRRIQTDVSRTYTAK